jgi:PadR family transcriptional regulator
MTPRKQALLQGTLDLLILKAVSAGELHGLGVSRRIQQITAGTFHVQPGSLFPALHRWEEAGWLESRWEASENNRRAKYYQLTKAGKRQLGEETAAWNAIALAIAGVACVVLVATTAAALPGWRASRVEPLAALRQE